MKRASECGESALGSRVQDAVPLKACQCSIETELLVKEREGYSNADACRLRYNLVGQSNIMYVAYLDCVHVVW